MNFYAAAVLLAVLLVLRVDVSKAVSEALCNTQLVISSEKGELHRVDPECQQGALVWFVPLSPYELIWDNMTMTGEFKVCLDVPTEGGFTTLADNTTGNNAPLELPAATKSTCVNSIDRSVRLYATPAKGTLALMVRYLASPISSRRRR